MGQVAKGARFNCYLLLNRIRICFLLRVERDPADYIYWNFVGVETDP